MNHLDSEKISKYGLQIKGLSKKEKKDKATVIKKVTAKAICNKCVIITLETS